MRRKMGVIAIVGNDGAWMQIARDQTRLLGAATACELAYTNYHLVVEGFGGKGFLLTSLAELPVMLQQAKEIAAKGIPVCDANVMMEMISKLLLLLLLCLQVLINCVIAKSDFREGSMSV